MAAVENRHVGLALLDKAPELALMITPVAEGAGELRLGGVSEVDDVAFAVAKDVDDEALHGLSVIVGEVYGRDVLVLVGLVADDDGDGVTVRGGVGGGDENAQA